mmetsp:Transcript_713/g.1186  ORF Transcript_713/g.1186 Transcript_713/m.1186 type:complete len:1243 (-) Transcript_713:336-4064(-)|eukprot:CAMPEP_0185017794 /NCGR_PEP_ID=MMETSP1103-20130426/689_1 /TAXON_ID=36769 /ORGANISM="Paraphysomonas bandaiensis, Strain Caron Lab Isolate" /LENGTH=1242 /DNA_ID=CAMNT_0027547369 /DNA_START=180 /DNA_END=3908 /DNA_ORIENTATION=-
MRPVDTSTQMLINIIVEEILTCDMCSKQMTALSPQSLPKTLDCSHTFCVACLEAMRTGMGLFSTIICPSCGVETTVGISGVVGLKSNHTISSLINILEAFSAITCSECNVQPATLRCTTCKDTQNVLCESCFESVSCSHLHHDVEEIILHTPKSSAHKTTAAENSCHFTPKVKSNQDENAVDVVECPRNIVGKVISARGATLEKIRSETQCNIDIRRLSDREAPALINIRGTREKVKKARDMIENAMEQAENKDTMTEDSPAVINISHYDAIDLFELRYDALNTIGSATGTYISLQSKDGNQMVVIRGDTSAERPQLLLARDRILELLEESNHQSSKSGSIDGSSSVSEFPEGSLDVADTIMLPKPQYVKLAAVGFAPLHRISSRVGCRIDLSEDFHMGAVTFRGNKLQVDEARQLFSHIFDNRPNSFTGCVPSDFSPPPTRSSEEEKRRPHSFTGHSTSSPAHEMLAASPLVGGVRIRSTRSTPMKEGPVSAYINCEYDSVGRLIGVKGSRITELREITGCRIYVRKGSDPAVPCTVEIRGMADDVAAAVPCLKMVLGSGDHAMGKIRAMLTRRNSECSIDDGNGHYQRESISRKSSISSLSTSSAPSITRLTRALQKHIDSTVREFRHQGSSIDSFAEPGTELDAGRTCRREDNTTKLDRLRESSSGSMSTSSRADYSGYDTSDEEGDNRSGSTHTTKYNLSPPPSPAPSRVYPAYFISTTGNKARESFECPRDKIPLLRGHLLTEIATKSRCQITLDEGPHLTSPVIYVYGKQDRRELAKFLIDSSVNPTHYRSPGQSRRDGLDGVIHTMDCPPQIIPVLIGPGGSTIEDVQLQSRTKILINEHTEEEFPPTISVIGTSAGVEIAVRLLDRLVMNHRFKYRQQHILSPNTRAKSMPISVLHSSSDASSVTIPPPPPFQEVDSFEDETGGRALLAPTPPPPECKQKLALRVRSGNSNSERGSNASAAAPLSGQSVLTDMTRGMEECSLREVTPPRSQNSIPSCTASAPVAVEIAKSMSQEIPPGFVEKVLFCPTDKVAQVIGKRGSILREIKRLSGCEVVVDQCGNSTSRDNDTPGQVSKPSFTQLSHSHVSPNTKGAASVSQVIRIIGTPEHVEAGKKLINDVIEVGPVVALNMKTVVMECPIDKVPLVIGIKGLTAKEMMRRTGCKIHVNEDAPEGSSMCTIELTGTEEQLAQAKQLLSHVLEFGTKALGKRFQRARKEANDDGMIQLHQLTDTPHDK